MGQSVINIGNHENRVLNTVNAKHRQKDKSKAIILMMSEYKENVLESELRREYIEKLEKIRKRKYIRYKSIEDLRKVTM